MAIREKVIFIGEYLLLLLIIICLVTAGLMISNIVISAVKPFVNPSAYPVTEDTGALTERQLEVFHGILDAAEAWKYYIQDYVIYLCTRDTGIPVYNALADLIGLYVEKA